MDLDKLSWKSVQFGDVGFNANFDGLIGIEECTDYGVVSSNKKKRIAKKEKNNDKKPVKRKAPNVENNENISPKKIKNTSFSDFKVETIDSNALASPSKGRNKQVNGSEKKCNVGKENQLKRTAKKFKNKEEKTEKNKDEAETKIKKKRNKKQKNKKGNAKENGKDSNTKKEAVEKEVKEIEAEVSLENMQAWSRFNLPEVIMKGLAVQNFTNPTMIQELTLPPAMFGRRDILGAAETGSGKTLAFGIPIINAILQLKEKPLMGVHETFRKPKKSKSVDARANNEQAKIINYNKLTRDERKKLLHEHKGGKKKKNIKKNKFIKDSEEGSEDSDPENEDSDNSENLDEDSDNSEDLDEGSDNSEELDEDSDNSELLDEDSDNSDDLDEDSDNSELLHEDSENSELENEDLEDENEDLDLSEEKNSKKKGIADKKKTTSEDSDFEENEEEVEGVNEKGIGCVKVIDNVISEDLPELTEKRKCLKPLYALILTPTRELAIQVKNHLVAAAKFTDISIAVVVGGMSQDKQERLLGRGPEIVVATPGRLWQLIQLGNPHLSQIPDIRFLAIDETDRMLERGHFEELHQLLERLNENEEKRGGRQNFVFSATLTMVHDLPKHLKKRKVTKKGKIINRKVEKLTPDQKMKNVIGMLGITDPKIVDVTKQNQGTSTTLTECRIMCPIEHKDYYLFYVLKRYPGRTIIFCNSIGCVKRLSQLFGLLQCSPLPLHANMQQRQRLKNLDRFRADPCGVLVATDVAARGLDIPDVEHVIHYQVPRTAENYVHRSGRTARASKEGITILIMEAGEVQNYNKMCKTLDKKEDLPHFPVDGPLLSAVMQRVDVARELDLLMLKVRNDNSQKGWLEKAAKEMDMLLDERNTPRQLEQEAVTNMKHTLTVRRKQLNSLLATPLFPKGFSFKYPTSNVQLEEALGLKDGQNAIEAMKSALETGLVRKRKNATKNQALLKLEKDLALVKKQTNQNPQKVNSVASQESGDKLSKNKWKKMRRTKE